MLQKAFDQFIREKRFLTNVSPKTIKYYGFVFNIWKNYINEFPDKLNVKEFVIKVQESGVSPFTANSYIRGINSFLTWAYENELTDTHLKIKKIKEPDKILKLFSEKQLKAMLSYKGKTFAQKRLSAMMFLAIDTGCRIDELLTLRTDCVDFDNLLIKVVGKGNKERILPISIECRKVLFKFLTHDDTYAFPSDEGGKLDYSTALKQFKKVCKQLGITGVRCSWHTIRHSFASSYVRDGGNVLYLQTLLGHTDLQTTKIYVKATTDDLSLMHKRTSLVSRLK